MRAILHVLTEARRVDTAQQDSTLPAETILNEQRPDQLLAGLLGLDGAVNVGDQLERSGKLRASPYDEGRGALHRQVTLTMLKRRSAIRTRVERRYAQAFEGTRPMPRDASILELLQQLGALADSHTRQVAAKKIAERFQHLFGSTLGVVRKELYWLREDTLRAVHSAGEQAQAWISLDHTIEAALEQATTKAHRTLETQLTLHLALQLERAIACLPQDCTTVDLKPWFARTGMIGRFLHESRSLCLCLLDVELNRLRGLAEACCGPLRAPGGQSSMWPPANQTTIEPEVEAL